MSYFPGPGTIDFSFISRASSLNFCLFGNENWFLCSIISFYLTSVYPGATFFIQLFFYHGSRSDLEKLYLTKDLHIVWCCVHDFIVDVVCARIWAFWSHFLLCTFWKGKLFCWKFNFWIVLSWTGAFCLNFKLMSAYHWWALGSWLNIVSFYFRLNRICMIGTRSRYNSFIRCISWGFWQRNRRSSFDSGVVISWSEIVFPNIGDRLIKFKEADWELRKKYVFFII